MLYCFRLGKGLGTREHLIVSVKINYIFGYGDVQTYKIAAGSKIPQYLSLYMWLILWMTLPTCTYRTVISVS